MIWPIKYGVSKKTLYHHHFSNKEELVTESLQFMLKGIENDIQLNLIKEKGHPLKNIIYIYRSAFRYMENFNPSFLFGLKKYYPMAHDAYEEFRGNIVYGIVLKLLESAQELKQIKSQINLKLFCDINLLRMEHFMLLKSDLSNTYSLEQFLEYIIIINIKGIMTLEYVADFKSYDY